MLTRTTLRSLAVALVVVLVVATAVWWLFLRDNTARITAYFSTSVGIYAGSDVRVLGVKVGTVGAVTPEGDQVKVTFTVDDDVQVPAQAGAVLISPTVVADRYLQLTPAYTGGPELADDAVIPRERTATPVELDQLTESVNTLAGALGPDGANSDGALSTLLDTTAQNLDGNGQALGDTITALSQATDTLASSREDLFGTVSNLQTFVSTLSANDAQVQGFIEQLTTFSSFLAGERSDLGAALNQLSLALGDVATFVRDNRESLSSNVAGLARVTQVVANQRQALAEVVDVAPLAADGVANAYNAEAGTLNARVNFNQISDPGYLLCNLIGPQSLVPGSPVANALGDKVGDLTQYCQTVRAGGGGKVILPTPEFLSQASGQASPLAAVPLPVTP